MGGRGGAGGGLGRATKEQRRIMGNMRAAISKDAHKSAPEFRVRSDGVVEYIYTETRNYARVHGGKMQSEEKMIPWSGKPYLLVQSAKMVFCEKEHQQKKKK